LWVLLHCFHWLACQLLSIKSPNERGFTVPLGLEWKRLGTPKKRSGGEVVSIRVAGTARMASHSPPGPPCTQTTPATSSGQPTLTRGASIARLFCGNSYFRRVSVAQRGFTALGALTQHREQPACAVCLTCSTVSTLKHIS